MSEKSTTRQNRPRVSEPSLPEDALLPEETKLEAEQPTAAEKERMNMLESIRFLNRRIGKIEDKKLELTEELEHAMRLENFTKNLKAQYAKRLVETDTVLYRKLGIEMEKPSMAQESAGYPFRGVFTVGILLLLVGLVVLLPFEIPETLKFVYKGTLPEMVSPKDVILMTLGRITSEGANYKSVEYAGPLIETMSIGGRMTLCNMAIEMGAKAGIIEADEKTLAYVRQRSNKSFDVVKPDKDAVYENVLEFDVSHLEPQVACPHAVDNIKNISQVEGKEIHQAVLGSCTNGRVEDLREAAEILRGKTIPIDVRLIVFPASREVYLEALKEGIIEVFITSGAVVCNPNCGPCCGGHEGIMTEGEVAITTFNRNFKGRMGKGAEIYLASPRVVAASALKGRIADPRKLA